MKSSPDPPLTSFHNLHHLYAMVALRRNPHQTPHPGQYYNTYKGNKSYTQNRNTMHAKPELSIRAITKHMQGQQQAIPELQLQSMQKPESSI